MNYPYPVHYLTLGNGCRVAYVDEGQGPATLVMVHGLATCSLSWKKNIDVLRQHYRCIAIDLPGNGLSDRGDYQYGINFFAGALYDVLQQLRLPNVCLVGHSMGGQVVMRLLLNAPAVAQRAVLCAPAGLETFTHLERGLYHHALNFLDMLNSEENSLRKVIRSSFYHYSTQADELIDYLAGLLKNYPAKQYRRMIDGCINGMLQEPVHDELPHLHQNILVIYGERDALIPNKIIHPITTRRLAEEAVALMPHGELQMVPQCGHFVQWEKADVVNGSITQWLGNGEM